MSFMCKSIYSCFLEIKFEVIITLLIIWSQNLKLNFMKDIQSIQLHLKLNSQITTKLMGDDEDWDPIRVNALKRSLSRRKSDRKRRKTQSGRERHLRTKHQARNTDEAKRARASQQERKARQQNPERMAQHGRTKNQARDTDEAKRAQTSQQERQARQNPERMAQHARTMHQARNVRRVGAENKVGLFFS